MDQRGNWSWTFHGIRKPDIERDLRRLTTRANHQQNANRREHSCPSRFDGQWLNLGEYVHEIQRPEMLDDQEESDQESEVANAVDNERFFPRRGRRIFLEPESDQQIR